MKLIFWTKRTILFEKCLKPLEELHVPNFKAVLKWRKEFKQNHNRTSTSKARFLRKYYNLMCIRSLKKNITFAGLFLIRQIEFREILIQHLTVH